MSIFIQNMIFFWNIEPDIPNLINIRQMFNLAIEVITAKPYILQKILFNEFVANALRENIGMIIFDLQGYGGC